MLLAPSILTAHVSGSLNTNPQEKILCICSLRINFFVCQSVYKIVYVFWTEMIIQIQLVSRQLSYLQYLLKSRSHVYNKGYFGVFFTPRQTQN